jgi:Pyruvate/2-oxoacid:ferredoxin oxidoreductase delta subunit
MGLAIVDQNTCLPFAGRQECDLCVQDCAAAGYDAIEFIRVGTEVDELGDPIEGSGFLAPLVIAEKCVGCGLCQMRCHDNYVNGEHPLLERAAIIVEAGPGKEDRLLRGSYLALREAEARARDEAEAERRRQAGGGTGYLPDDLQ